ncbi:MAG: hypothetical protein ACOCWA_06600, partial [Bacteroidota bacterium]
RQAFGGQRKALREKSQNFVRNFAVPATKFYFPSAMDVFLTTSACFVLKLTRMPSGVVGAERGLLSICN